MNVVLWFILLALPILHLEEALSGNTRLLCDLLLLNATKKRVHAQFDVHYVMSATWCWHGAMLMRALYLQLKNLLKRVF